jgi:tetratricopeptide (TPR) repeat protein
MDKPQGSAILATSSESAAGYELQQRAVAEEVKTIGELLNSGKTGEANQRLVAMVNHYIDIPEAHMHAAMAYIKIGSLADAVHCFSMLLTKQPSEYVAQEPLRSIMLKTVELYRKSTKPTHDGLLKCAYILYRLQHIKEAEAVYEELLATTRGKERAALMIHLVDFYREKEMFEKALECAEEGVKLAPGSLAHHYALGLTYLLVNRAEDAVTCFKKTLEIEPNFIEGHKGLCGSYANLGDFDKLNEAADKALAIIPHNPQIYFALVRGNKFKSLDDPRAKELIALHSKSSVFSPNEQVYYHYALGKLYTDVKHYDEAFTHYKQGADLKYKLVGGYDLGVIRYAVDLVKNNMNPTFFETWKGLGNPSEQPVFIVGMPRSGTTLTERIIASHPQGAGAGELMDIECLIKELDDGESGKVNDCLSPEKIARFSERYLTTLHKYAARSGKNADDCLRITDKMPFNYRHLWFIAILFPNAKIIHTKRNPYDTILSNYFQLFGEKNGYSYNLEVAAHYYKLYEELMTHWEKVLPIPIYTVEYQNLVNNPSEEIPKLIEYVGLPWDDACLSPEKNEAPVQTLSNWQVRQPIYTSSVERWKRYEKYLGGVKAILEGE